MNEELLGWPESVGGKKPSATELQADLHQVCKKRLIMAVLSILDIFVKAYYRCFQKIEACPFCSHQSRWPAKLRKHIERFHERELKDKGRTKISNMILWRSKSNMRRISFESVNSIVSSICAEHCIVSNAQVFDIIKKAFQRVLVKISDDENV